MPVERFKEQKQLKKRGQGQNQKTPKQKQRKSNKKAKQIKFLAFILRPNDLLFTPSKTRVTTKDSFKIFFILHQPGTELNTTLVTTARAHCNR